MGNGIVQERLLIMEKCSSLFGEWLICNSDRIGLSPLWAPRKEEGQVKRRGESDSASSPEEIAAGGSKK